MKEVMTKDAAFEMDSFLTGMEAAVSTLLTIHEHFCTGESISESVAQELDAALFTISIHMKALVNGERKKVNETFAALQAENEAAKKAERLAKVAAKEFKKVQEEKK